MSAHADSARVVSQAVTPIRLRYGNPWWSLIAVALGVMMVGLDATIVSVANPTIGRHFHASLPGLQWVTNGYLLALAVTLIPSGKLGDRFGRKPLFAIGVVGFAVTSVACGLSSSIGELIAFRVLQGLSGALLMPQSLAILRAAFPVERLAAAVGIWAMTSSVAISAGPILGGLLVQHVSWRSIFYVNAPVAAVCVVVTSLVVRNSRDETGHHGLDPLGMALLSGSLFALVYGVIQAEQHSWSHTSAVTFLAAAVVLLGAFIAWERRATDPYIPLSLFRSRQLSSGVATVMAVQFALFGVIFYIALYLQRVHGFTPLQAGVRMLPATVLLGVGSAVSGYVVDRIGPRVPLLFGAVVVTGGLVGLVGLKPHTPYSSIWPFLAIIGLGVGPIITGSTQAIVGSAPEEQAGIAGGLQSVAFQVGGVLGTSVLGSIVTSRVTSLLPGKLMAAGVPAALADQLKSTSHAVAQGVVAIPQGVSASTRAAITNGSFTAFTKSLGTAMIVSAAVLAIVAVVSFLVVRPSRSRVSRLQGSGRRLHVGFRVGNVVAAIVNGICHTSRAEESEAADVRHARPPAAGNE
jgi:EmrB/QacA subfamily drug resistance transporter